jgi:nitrile hydratase subunit alpha
MLLGPPPAWYKHLAYRARVVRDPRGVLQEFGMTLPADVEVRVHDSTADLRYIVLPECPPGAAALPPAQLERLVTRDTMIGTARPML